MAHGQRILGNGETGLVVGTLPSAPPLPSPELSPTSHHVINGFGWQIGNTLARQAIGFVTMVILARLLTPAEFGLVGIAVMFSMWVGIAGDAGIGAALIRQDGLTDADKRAGFWMAAAAGGLSALALALLAGPLSRFYGQPALRLLIHVNALNLAVGGLNAVPGALLRRALSFRYVAVVETLGTLTSSIGSVLLAATHVGAVSIPLGSLVGLLVSFAIYLGLQLVHVWPWPRWAQIAGLSRFALLVSGGRIAEVFRVSIDNAFVGRLLGPQALGYYSLSYNLIAIPEYRVVGLITQVAFPALARLQVDLERVRQAYLRLLRYVLLIVLPVLLGLQLVADQLIPLIYGEPWRPAVPILQILCVSGIGSAMAVLTDAPLLALGHAHWIFRLNLAWLALLGLGLGAVLATGGGLPHVAGVVAAVAVLLCLGRNAVTLRLCRVSARAVGEAIYPAFVATLAMVVVVSGIKAQVHWATASWPSVIAVVLAGMAGYGAVALALLPELRGAGRRWLAARREPRHDRL